MSSGHGLRADVADTLLATGAGRPSEAIDLRVRTLFAFVRRMSGRQQLVICGLAFAIAALEAVPLELQRRIVNDDKR